MSKSTIQTFPYLFQPNTGPPIAAEWGQLFVPENRHNPDSQYITIPFVRFKCTSKNPGPPIIFLQGGPGESLLADLKTCWDRPMWRPPLEIADFIFIEQRGSGLSKPCLSCPGTYNIPLDELGSTEIYQSAHRQYMSRAVSFWQSQEIDLNGYNVKEMASDINDLRVLLNYKKVSLLGGSFGTHHGFALLRFYGSFIERAFFFGIEGPDHTLKLPGNIQKSLVNLDTLVKKDFTLNAYIPDLLDLMVSVLERLEQKPVTVETIHPQTKEKVPISLSKYDLQLVTAKGMGTTPFIRELPKHYLAMKNGDFSWLAEQVILERVNLKSNLMYEATDCTSGATEVRRKQIAKEALVSLLGNAINEPFHEFCDVICKSDKGKEIRCELTSDVPVLLVSGSLDVRTPESNAKELLPSLKNAQLLTIDGVSHDMSIRGDHIEDLTRCRDQFFRGEPLKIEKLQSSFAFQPIEIENL